MQAQSAIPASLQECAARAFGIAIGNLFLGGFGMAWIVLGLSSARKLNPLVLALLSCFLLALVIASVYILQRTHGSLDRSQANRADAKENQSPIRPGQFSSVELDFRGGVRSASSGAHSLDCARHRFNRRHSFLPAGETVQGPHALCRWSDRRGMGDYLSTPILCRQRRFHRSDRDGRDSLGQRRLRMLAGLSSAALLLRTRKLRDAECLARFQIPFAAEPVFHRISQPIQRHARACLQQPVANRQRVIKNGVVGEVPHGEIIDPLHRAQPPIACCSNGFDLQFAQKHAATFALADRHCEPSPEHRT